MTDYIPGDHVEILVGGPHEHIGRTATVNSIQYNGDLVIYFGDQDEDEWVYSPGEVRKIEVPGRHYQRSGKNKHVHTVARVRRNSTTAAIHVQYEDGHVVLLSGDAASKLIALLDSHRPAAKDYRDVRGPGRTHD